MLYRFGGGFELDEALYELRRTGSKIAVQPKVLAVLLLLVRERARLLSKQEILERIWGDVNVTEASLSRAIMEARKAIDDDEQQVIVTVRGAGFRFAAPVEVREPGARPRIERDATFVGRGAALGALLAHHQAASAGHAALVWLTGEAGIGKTRLAHELAETARRDGARVYVVRCHQLPAAPPFWVFSQILRAHVAETGDPEAEQVQASLGTAAARTGADLGPASGLALYDSATRVLVRASQAAPITIVIEDVHWADVASLQVMRFFARAIEGARILVVATYRDTALDDAEAGVLGDLVREHAAFSLRLRGLGREEIAELVEIVKGAAPSPALTTALLERSGGNPCYVHQLLHTEWAERALAGTSAVLASSIDLQPALVASIGRHLDAVSAACRDMLALAAMLGREFDLAKLGAVMGKRPDELLAWIEEAEKARILVRNKAGRHAFGHALVRDVLYQRSPAAERAARHHAVATALEKRYSDAPEAHAQELAQHLFRALPIGDPRHAFEACLRAGEQVEALGDHAAAASHFAQAVEALASVQGHEPRRLPVQLALGRARARSGELPGARDAFADAAILARALGDRDALVRAAKSYAEISPPEDARRVALLAEAGLREPRRVG